MSNATQKKVPALRFPEFSGEWEGKPLGKLFPQIRNGFVGTATPFYQRGGVAYLQGKNIKSGSIDPKGLVRISLAFHEKQKKSQLRTNDILMVQSGHVGECAVVSNEYEGANCHALIVMTPTKSVNSFFIRDLFYAPAGLRHIYKIKTGNTIEHILTSDLKPLTLHVPSYPEQEKIASFLSSVDRKIEQLATKKQLLERYKKGMMQKIFNQEIRFKDDNGNSFPAWDEKILGSLYEFKSTNSLSRDQLNYSGGEVYNIHYGDIHTKFKSRFELLYEDVPFINSDINLDEISEDKYCKEGDLVIADASEDYDDIGKTIELTNLSGKKVLAGLHTLLARPSSDDIYVGFGAYLIASKSVRKQIKLIAQGTKVLGISAGRVSKVKLSIPSSKDEQQKIADFLSSLDNKVDLIDTELSQAQAFKKGLLQQMFV